MKYNGILIRYDEIGLKSYKTRKKLVDRLIKNIKASLGIENVSKSEYTIKEEYGRVYLFSNRLDSSIQALRYVFGISSFSKVHYTTWNDYNELTSKAATFSKTVLTPGTSFAVRVRRTGQHKFKSIDVARDAGSAINKTVKNLRVDLNQPDIEINIEIRNKDAYYFVEKISGPGGMPLGSAGSVVSLFSGGIDSPVATWMIMKRGAIPILFNLLGGTYSDPQNTMLTKKMANQLARWAPGINLLFITANHALALHKFVERGPKGETCILCKRQMLRLAEQIAKDYDALAIVTGDSLSQVASQTLTNIRVLSEAVELPILRPLIGMDKKDIISLAKKIGTLGLEAKNAGDCTAVPKYPQTAADLDWLKGIEEKYLELSKLVNTAIDSLKTNKFSASNPLD